MNILKTLLGIETMIDTSSSDDYGRYTKMAIRLEPDCAQMVLGNGVRNMNMNFFDHELALLNSA